MNAVHFRSLAGLMILAVGFIAPRPLLGQERPKAEAVLEKYVEVTGGKAAYEKIKNRVMSGTMEIAGTGVKGKVTITHAAPNKMYLDASFEGLGKFEQGTNGEVVWEKNAISGARIKTGDERAHELRNATFNEDLNWRKIYKSIDNAGEEAIDGKPCYKLEMITQEGQKVTKYFNKQSGLAVKLTTIAKTQMGDLPTEAIYEDYKKVDGILMPHKIRQKVLTQEIIISMEKIEQNANLPDNRFDLPEEIKKLAEKK